MNKTHLVKWGLTALITVCIGLFAFSFTKTEQVDEPAHVVSSAVNTLDINTLNINNNPASTGTLSPEAALLVYEDFINNKPKYLKGTDLRGGFHFTSEGVLIITRSIRQRFDYFFLMSEDSNSQQSVFEIIYGHLVSKLQGDALQQVIVLLENYALYRQQYANLVSSNTLPLEGDTGVLENLQQDVFNLRRNILGEEVADVFFSHEERLQNAALKRLNKDSTEDSSNNNTLTANQQKTLSYELNQVKMAERILTTTSEQDKLKIRTSIYGDEAAKRLAVLDHKRNEDKTQLEFYKNLELELTNSGLTKDDRQDYISQEMMAKYQLTELQLKRLASLAQLSSTP